LLGHGHFDMAAYDKYFAGELEDVALDEAEIERSPACDRGSSYPRLDPLLTTRSIFAPARSTLPARRLCLTTTPLRLREVA
jgi:hypothetical protein